MKKRTFFIIIGLLILLSNWGALKEMSGINNGYYRYSNLSGTATIHEIFWQGRVLRNHGVLDEPAKKYFVEKHPGSTDTVIHRLFAINPLKFWRWGEYIFSWRYRLPYANWEEIVKRRGYREIMYSNNFQEF